jgi:hypothetical protein
MRPISRHVLAQQLANIIARTGTAACQGRGQWWSEREAEHAAATTRSAAVLAAAPAMELCARCPIVASCTELATLDQYTGLAAGAAVFRGTRAPTSRLRNASAGQEPMPVREAG